MGEWGYMVKKPSSPSVLLRSMLGTFEKLWRTDSRAATVINHMYAYPAPTSLNANYTFGSLSGLALVIQLVTGLLLTMHYVPSTSLAFESVEHIMRDVEGGTVLRYAHANGASFFFFNVYLHIARSLYYKNYVKNVLAWYIGILIFFAIMAAAFLGYVLPWGQMSFWGATVITNLFSVIPFVGEYVVTWLWGGFGVGGPTLNRFYTLHFLIPFVALALAAVHIYALHCEGSATPNFANHSSECISFGYYFVPKDIVLNTAAFLLFICFILFAPNDLNHPDNYIPANAMQTPPHIVPEWYFLPFYAILRTIPSKGLGVVAMGLSIVFLFVLPSLAVSERRSTITSREHKIAFWVFCTTTVLLGFLGGQPIMFPYSEFSFLLTLVYFAYAPYLHHVADLRSRIQRRLRRRRATPRKLRLKKSPRVKIIPVWLRDYS